MIFSAFDVKFDETKNEIPPGACRPSKKLKNNNVEKVDPQKVRKNNNVDKEGIYSYINIYIYVHIKIYIYQDYALRECSGGGSGGGHGWRW